MRYRWHALVVLLTALWLTTAILWPQASGVHCVGCEAETSGAGGADQSGTAFHCVGTTSTDTDECTMSPVIDPAPADGSFIKYRPSATNVGPASLDVCGGGSTPCPVNIYRLADQGVLEDGDLVDDSPTWLVFCSLCDAPDGAWILTNPAGGNPAPAAHATSHEDGGTDELDLTGLGGVDHGLIAGLTDNDHPQYACLGCASVELTLDTNGDATIPATGGVLSIDTFAGAATDIWDGMPCTANTSFVLRAENVARVVTIASASIPIWGDSDFALDEAADRVFGICPATNTPYLYAVFNAAGRIDVQELGVGAATYDIRSQALIMEVFPPGTVITTGDQQSCLVIPNSVIWATTPVPMVLQDLEIRQQNVADTTGLSVMVSRKRMSSATAEGTVDMLSAACTTDANEFYSADDATGCTVNTSNDDVQPGDRVCVDVDTAADGEGLSVWMLFGP